MAKLLYQGHGSFRITAKSGMVIYVDPYAGGGYDMPADLVLVTHQHYDHNEVDKMPHKAGCRVIQNGDALKGGAYHSFTVGDARIEAVPAYNHNHKKEECVGYIIRLDGVSLYAAGDTSTTEAMKSLLPGCHLDYALLPIDGVYNMDAGEASACAELIGARHSIPIHMVPGKLFDREAAERFTAQGRMIVQPGEEIEL